MNLHNLRIGARLGIGFGIVLSLVALMIVTTGVLSASSKARLSDGLVGANTKVMLATAMKSALLEAGISMRNIGLQSDVSVMKKEEANVMAQRGRYAEAATKLATSATTDAEKKLLAELARLDVEMDAPIKEAIRQVGAFNSEDAIKLITTSIDPVNEKALVEINKLVDIQQGAAHIVLDSSSNADKNLMLLLAAIGIVAIGVGIFFAWIITRSITHPLHDAVAVARCVASGELTANVSVRGKDEISQLMHALKDMNDSLLNIVGKVRVGTDAIATASGEIASGNADLSARTESQAGALEETASSMEQLTATVRQNADNAKQANQLVVSASDFAVKGGHVVGQVVDTMKSIKDSSRKIADIISVIDSIAFQTNILALNAAVEAARAGEQGRGFAVVAAEVRNLAQRSASAAKEIKLLIGDSVAKVDLGGSLVDHAGKTMQDIVSSVKQVADIMTEISAASHEQQTGIEHVNEAIGQMDQMTQQNAALVEEAAAAAESMREQAFRLTEAMRVFKMGEAAPQPEARKAAAKVAVARFDAGARFLSLPRPPQPKHTVLAGADEWEAF